MYQFYKKIFVEWAEWASQLFDSIFGQVERPCEKTVPIPVRDEDTRTLDTDEPDRKVLP